jgi:GAF domain-containing protein
VAALPRRAAGGGADLASIQALTSEAGVAAALADPERLREIEALDLLDPAADAVLEDAARRAAAWLGVPRAEVSVLLDEAHFVAALHGAEGWLASARAMPSEWSICRYAASAGATLVVEDTARDPRTRDNPVVYLDGIGCYAGVPLTTAGGHVLGTLCVAGTHARTFSADDVAMLRALAREVMARLEARRGCRRVARPARRAAPPPRRA